MYVFDNSPLSSMFRNYFPARFPSLWARFDALVAAGDVVSTREALREIRNGPEGHCLDWCNNNQPLFAVPNAAEAGRVAQIFAVPHFQQNIEMQKILKGGLNADPFVIARAMAEGKAVVTMEAHKPNSAKIPNICEHFHVRWLNLEAFMEEQGWMF
ncbi:MAG TPA: DUF4411 family protein [Rhizomicrobium sp.]|jgi:hypothetical protein